MFLNNMWSSVKMMIRARDVLMWLLFFPIILATVFYFAFGGLSSTAVFKKADIAVFGLDNNIIFSNVLNEISDSGGQAKENDLFNVKIVTKEEGEQLVKQEKVDAFLIVTNEKIEFYSSGMDINSTVVKTFVDAYLSNINTIKQVAVSPEQAAYIANQLRNEVTITTKQISKNAVDQNTTYFYALLGMVIFYFSLAGLEIIKTIKPSQSVVAARISISASSRNKVFLTTYTGMVICCIFIIFVMLGFIGGILGVPLGNFGLVLTACVIGMFAALGFGMFFATLPIKKHTVKYLILIIFTLLLSLLNGLMGANVKEIIVDKVPFINYINPAALIADCFHSLYYYDGLSEFGIRLGILGGYAIAFTGIAIFNIRRKKYANI